MLRTRLNLVCPSLLAIALASGCSSSSSVDGDDGNDGTEGAGDESGDETGDTSGSENQRFELRDGVFVEVTPEGRTWVEVDGRVTVTFTEQGPVARTFNETVQGTTAIYQFSRSSESTFALDTFVSASQNEDDASVTVEWQDAAGDTRGRMRLFNPADDDPQDMTRIEFILDAGEADSLAVGVLCDEDGSFHGFGGQYNQSDQRGEAFDLVVQEQGIGRDPEVEENPPILINGSEHTTYFPAPYFLDQRGHGMRFDTPRRVEVDLCAADSELAWFEVIDGRPLDMELFHGPTPAAVVEQLGAVVGRPTTPPDWAFLPWIAAQGGRDEVLAEVAALEAAGIPFSALWVQDWTGIRMNLDGGFGVQYRWLPDEELYPDLAGMIDLIHQGGYRFLGYANPFVPTNLEHYPEMSEQGLLIGSPDDASAPYLHAAPNGIATHPDLTNPDTVAYVQQHLGDMVSVYGMDGWMADFSEWIPFDTQFFDGSDARDIHNVYPRMWQSMTREVMDELRPDGDWVMFARAGWPGVQEVSQIHWIGDQEADWSPYDGLPTVVPAMTNLGLSGVPITTHDIAGFSGGPSTKELWQRWTELGAFSPIMRTHEGADKLENWSWEKDTETTEHFARFSRIHEALAPELSDMADEAGSSSLPMARHLMLEFPNDPQVFDISDQFMLGSTLLVAPITEEGSTSRSVYLPEGTWFHLWTGDSYEGPMTLDIDAPIGSPPVFSLGVDREDLRSIQ